MKLHAPFSLKDRACAWSWLGQRAGECCAKTTREPGKEPKINQVSGKKLSHSAGQAGASRITGREGAGCWDSITQRDFCSSSPWKECQLPAICMLGGALY